MQNKRGDIPAHKKNAKRNTNYKSTECIYITQVFRRKKQCIGPIAFHKPAVDGAAQQIPEYQQYLKLSEMQHKKLNRKKIVNICK